ncbi:Techylectin-5A [Araneus ventricosus]|uniref:Techylectin-5A n=1 Tax=Araneus ventricosus TaxID=182803 RepID=A0A4Y2IKB7_ARAVE|nr:Techylectin-5A [Araneus ventricosus]
MKKPVLMHSLLLIQMWKTHRHLVMCQILLLLVFQSFCTSQILGSDYCDYNGRFESYLDVAVDLINKAKSYVPERLITSKEKTCRPMDCADVLRSGYNRSGVYYVWPRSRLTDGKLLEVYCDMDTDDGGWTVIQRRGNFSRSADYFYKDWSSYKNGFGDIQKDFWLGNDNIFALTNQRVYSIRFDLTNFEEEKRHALYDIFWIDNESLKYTLHIQNYSGDAGDSMILKHANQKFSTYDQDNDGRKEESCALKTRGAWWYGSCYHANLNGVYASRRQGSKIVGISWYTFTGFNESLYTTEMKIRPANFEK